MDPRFSVRHGSLLDNGVHPYVQGTRTVYPSYITPLQTYHTGVEQPMLNVGEHVIPSSFPSAGRSYLVADPSPQAAVVYQELPASALGVTVARRNAEVPALNNSYQIVNVAPPVAETARPGYRSVYAPSYTDASGIGRGYGSSTPAYVYQPYSQVQVRAGSTLLSPEPLGTSSGRPLMLEKEPEIQYSHAGLLTRRREAEQRTKLERQRVLDHKRELKPRRNLETLKLPPVRQNDPRDKQQIQKFQKKSNDAGLNKIKGTAVQGTKKTGKTRCAICKIDCNSAQMLQNHIKGKKHKAQVEAKKASTGVKKKPEAVVKEDVKKDTEAKIRPNDGTEKIEQKENATKGKIDGEMMAAPDGEMKEKAARLAKTERNKRKRARRAARRKALLVQKQQKVEEVNGTVDDAVSKALLEIQKIGADFTVQVTSDVKMGLSVGDTQADVDAVEKIVEVQEEDPSEGVTEGVSSGGKDDEKHHVEITSTEAKPDVEMVEQNSDGEGIPEKVAVEDEAAYKQNAEADSTPDGAVTEAAETKSEAKGTKSKAGAHAQSKTVRCEVCAVTCRNATVYESHLKSEKHAERLKKSLEGVKGKPTKAKNVVSS